MSGDTYDGIAQNLTEKMKLTLTPANDGVFSKNCLGVVTAKGGICVHCRYLRKTLLTRKSKVSLHPVKEALKIDGSNVTLQAMPGITTRHIQPNNFEKMRVTLAYQLFSDAVLNGLRLYKNDVEAICGNIQPVLTFFG
ncbi:hypothetical protein MTO96_046637 [Rhipicephalus appendiculatus]